MSDETMNVAEAAVADDKRDGDRAKADFKLGIAPLDNVVKKIDEGVRKISAEIHNPPPPEEDPDRQRVRSGIQPLDNVVHRIDDSVRRISQGIHKAVDSKKS